MVEEMRFIEMMTKRTQEWKKLGEIWLEEVIFFSKYWMSAKETAPLTSPLIKIAKNSFLEIWYLPVISLVVAKIRDTEIIRVSVMMNSWKEMKLHEYYVASFVKKS